MESFEDVVMSLDDDYLKDFLTLMRLGEIFMEFDLKSFKKSEVIKMLNHKVLKAEHFINIDEENIKKESKIIKNLEYIVEEFGVEDLKNILKIKNKIKQLSFYLQTITMNNNGIYGTKLVFKDGEFDFDFTNNIQCNCSLYYNYIDVKEIEMSARRGINVEIANSKLENVYFTDFEENESEFNYRGNATLKLYNCQLDNVSFNLKDNEIYFYTKETSLKSCFGEIKKIYIEDLLLKEIDISNVKIEKIILHAKNKYCPIEIKASEISKGVMIENHNKCKISIANKNLKIAKNQIVSSGKENLVLFKDYFIDKKGNFNEKYFDFLCSSLNKEIKGIFVKKKKEIYIEKENIETIKKYKPKRKFFFVGSISLGEYYTLFLNEFVKFHSVEVDLSYISKEEIIINLDEYKGLKVQKIKINVGKNVKRILFKGKGSESVSDKIEILGENINNVEFCEKSLSRFFSFAGNSNKITINGLDKDDLRWTSLKINGFKEIYLLNCNIKNAIHVEKEDEVQRKLFLENTNIRSIGGNVIEVQSKNSTFPYRYSLKKIMTDSNSEILSLKEVAESLILIGKPKNYEEIKDKKNIIFV